MPEVRDTTILVHIEPTFATMLKDVCKDKITLSSYVRSLIIQDLESKGLLNDNKIRRIVVGGVS